MIGREETERGKARSIRLALSAVMLALVTVPLAVADGTSAPADCSTPPERPVFELVYRLHGVQAGDAAVRDEAVRVICERVRTLDVGGLVEGLGDSEVRVVLPRPDGAVSRRAIEWIGARGQLLFYDWEPNLIGQERGIGGEPGSVPPRDAVRRAEREWQRAGRNPDRFPNRQLLLDGAYPNLYGAVRLASGQRPRQDCDACSAQGPRFYLFERTPRHRLIAGPTVTRAGLRARASGKIGVVLKVPPGTAIVAQNSSDEVGRVRPSAAPGWFALRDRPGLTGADIVDPEQEFGVFNEPNVTFGFTPRGRIAFERLTADIARRGQARARGPVGNERAEELSGSFALVIDGVVRVRPIVNFAQNPDGIDGRTGVQISGGFSTVQEAQDLATMLRIGPLPVAAKLVRRSPAEVGPRVWR